MGDVEQRVADLLDRTTGCVPWLNGDLSAEDVTYDDLLGGVAEVVRGVAQSVLLVAREIDLLRDEITSHRPPD
jgi:hypothetical protein